MKVVFQGGFTPFFILLFGGILFTLLLSGKFFTPQKEITPLRITPNPSFIETKITSSSAIVAPAPTIKPTALPVQNLPEIHPSSSLNIYISSVKRELENNKLKLTLEGKGFGDKAYQIMMDGNIHNYGYEIISWTDNRIEFYASEWVPKDKTIMVAVIGNDGVKSNSVSFF